MARTIPGPPRAFIVMAKFSFAGLVIFENNSKSHVPANSSAKAIAKNEMNRNTEKS